MIQHLLLVPLLMLASSGIAQIEQQFNFDDGSIGDVHIDTTDGHGGLWQIGTPQKQMFTSPYSSPNVIVTDTQHSYPPNDTSRFTIVHIAEGGWMSACCAISLTGYYQVDADSLNDFGTMEFSYAPLSAWIDVIHDASCADGRLGIEHPYPHRHQQWMALFRLEFGSSRILHSGFAGTSSSVG